jgi:hypothetical protein
MILPGGNRKYTNKYTLRSWIGVIDLFSSILNYIFCPRDINLRTNGVIIMPLLRKHNLCPTCTNSLRCYIYMYTTSICTACTKRQVSYTTTFSVNQIPWSQRYSQICHRLASSHLCLMPCLHLKLRQYGISRRQLKAICTSRWDEKHVGEMSVW